ncbi:MBL fold metallo-hydrolase [Streptomyces sp. INA 01156]
MGLRAGTLPGALRGPRLHPRTHPAGCHLHRRAVHRPRRRPGRAATPLPRPGHTSGDIVAWLPRHKVLFAGDLVETQAALYTGDAYHREWATDTLDRVAALGAEVLVGGRASSPGAGTRSRRRSPRRGVSSPR